MFIEGANLFAVIAVPATGALISFLHRQNTNRWIAVEKQLKKARKLARFAVQQHDSFAARLSVIEREWADIQQRKG